MKAIIVSCFYDDMTLSNIILHIKGESSRV